LSGLEWCTILKYDNTKMKKHIILSLNFIFKGLFFLFLFFSCKRQDVLGEYKFEENTEVFKLKTNQNSENTEIFIVSRPPENFGEIILFFQKEVDHFYKNVNNKKCYARLYYKERFFFNRTYVEPPPHSESYVPFDILFFSGANDIGSTHQDDFYVSIIFKDETYEDELKSRPITPYLYIEKYKLYYYPKGLKNNPDIHWELGRYTGSYKIF
jgi:hypothetical protein